MGEKFYTLKTSDSGAQIYWWSAIEEKHLMWVWSCCGGSDCPNGVAHEMNSKYTPVVVGPIGYILCADAALALGHGVPPAELLGESVNKVESIKAKEPNFSASYWRIAASDLKCKECMKTIIPAGSIYLNRLDKTPSCIDCAAKQAINEVLWVPTLADFGVQGSSKMTEFKSGLPTAKAGWIWVKAGAEDSAIGDQSILLCKCLTFDYKHKYCQNTVIEGNIYAVDQKSPSNILCTVCAGKQGFGYPGMMFSSSNNVAKPIKKRQKKAPMICIKCNQALCEACGECETKGCRLVGKAICTPEQLAKVKYLLAETQKVRGYVALAETLTVPKPYQIVTEQSDIETLSIGSPVFVRPCPIRPRHGFVESRLVDSMEVNTKDTIHSIYAEAKAADPQAELLIVPYVDSAYNMVITPTRLAIGAGNDGATAGKGSITVPLMGERFAEIKDKLYEQAGVDIETEDPYFEAVADKNHRVSFTQLRAGVKIPAAVGDDFIPRDMIVEEVIDASGDLLEWESQVKRIKSGTVVCHVGGTLTSHYGVHCLYNNIPVMTSRRPTIGEFLAVKEKGAAPDPESIKRGLSVGVGIPLIQDWRYTKDNQLSCRDAIRVLLVALHNAGAMGEKDGFWIGFAAAIMQRVGMAASHGEARHKNVPKSGKVSRPAVYKVALGDFFAARETLGAAQWSFKNLAWSSGYGGPKWAKCTEATIDLDTAIRDFLNDPSERQVGTLITKLNNAVNQAHNGGWWLNKFVDVNEFDRAAAQNINLIAQAGIGMFRAANAKLDDLSGVVERWRIAPPIVIAKGEILAYTKSEGKHKEINGIPTCVGCGKEFPQLKKYSDAIAEGMSCDECSDTIKFKLDGEWIEVEESDSSDPDSGCNCSVCQPPTEDDEEDPGFDPPEPPEIGKHTNVNSLVKLEPTHKIIAAQGKWIKGDYFHIQLKTNATEGYYSFDLKVPSLNLQKIAPYSIEWTWSGSESHEYVTLAILDWDPSDCHFKNDAAGIDFNFSPITGTFKDNLYEQAQKQVEAGSEGIKDEELPF